MRMRIALARRAARDRISPPVVAPLRLADPVDYPVRIFGIASAGIVDLERVKFRNWSLSFDPHALPPLLVRHDPERVAGVIESLTQDSAGLHIIARVDDSEARRLPALSVAGTVHEWEMRNENASDWHAVVLKSTIDEVSLTDRPACPAALVRERVPVSLYGDYYALAIARVGKLIELARLIPRLEPPPRPADVQRPMPRSSRGSFAALAAELNARSL
jgi:hypothetical protein